MIDASALLQALIDKGGRGSELRGRLAVSECHAQHLTDAEIGNVLRRHERAGRLSASEASAALKLADALLAHRYPHRGGLAARAWELRDRLTFYDALYVTLAERLGLALLSADQRISRTRGLSCTVEVT